MKKRGIGIAFYGVGIAFYGVMRNFSFAFLPSCRMFSFISSLRFASLRFSSLRFASAAGSTDSPPAASPPEPPMGNLDNASLFNPAGLTMNEFWSSFKAKIESDVNMVADKIIPKPLQGPIKGTVKRALKITKTLVTSGARSAKR